ncbi:hypothetical protein K466DRAFT_523255 [Polyporus arcularius HHB13444]|uniref:G-protein coupled receptors family 1 profile domain-containing protein n=1 Tax=Polyporus arcularius HHB13444 TaxID=1314778 RepID=A0A5C3PCC4_9APHY|nr:hypothetical protein K466DRAFT_523255 [Polyporus arcularius HHB13444]
MAPPFAQPVDSSVLVLPPEVQIEFDGVVDLLIVETVFPTLLVPIAICLFMITKPEIQRKPVFFLNVFSIVLGLVFGGIAIATVSRSISGHLVSPAFVTALSGLYFFIPVCVQCILFVRIFAVYPPRSISRLLAFTLYGTLFAMTVARVVNLVITLIRMSDAAHHAASAWAVLGVGRRIPSVTAELSMGLLYDIIASTLFLYRLHQGGALKGLKRAENDIVSSAKRASYPARLRALFWIALTNFVVPVIFNVLLLILFRTETDLGDSITVIAIISVNVYVQIVSGLLATLWSSGSSRETTARSTENPMLESISTLKFAPASTTLTSHIHVEVEV